MTDGGMRIEVVVLDPRLHQWGLPACHSAMAAGVDLHACLDAALRLEPGVPPVLVPAGFAMHIAAAGVAALILPRSGAGHRRGLVLGNTVGLIDADYTGPVLVSAWNRNPPGGAAVVIEPGERFAQMVFVPVLRPALRLVETFSTPSGRGDAGFGSTG